MTGKDKFIYIILCIITFGIYPIMINKKKQQPVSSELTVENKVTINSKKVIEFVGGANNIAGTEHTHTKIKIFIKDRNKVSIEDIKNIKGISGVVAGTKYVTILVGKQAKALAAQL